MRIAPLHVSHSDLRGGASRAAYRIHTSLREAGVDSGMRVALKLSDDWTVRGPRSRMDKGWTALSFYAGVVAGSLCPTGSRRLRSPAFVRTGLGRELNADTDHSLIHLHWVGAGMISIAEIGRLQRPVLWTLHDMWAFCGAEHLSADSAETRFRSGYRRDNRPSDESGFDLNRWTWERKRRHWRRGMVFVTPSKWLARCAKESLLLRDEEIHTIPNPIDTAVWRPADKLFSRDALGIPQHARIALFGALEGTEDPNKGADLLFAALHSIEPRDRKDIQLVIFGQSQPRTLPDLPMPVRYLGALHDDVSLRLAYSAADVMIVPSRLENLPQTAVEAQACGVPVVAFDTAGIPEVVDHQITGYLAKPFDAADLATGILWVLEDQPRRKALAEHARGMAERRFSSRMVSQAYVNLYDAILKRDST